MHNYISGVVQVRTMLIMLHKEVQTNFKPLYLSAMEASICFHPDTITQIEDVIVDYQAWHHYLIERHQVEVSKLKFPQNQT